MCIRDRCSAISIIPHSGRDLLWNISASYYAGSCIDRPDCIYSSPVSYTHLVMEFYGKSFPEAVQMLTGENGEGQAEATTAPTTAFHLPLHLSLIHI